MADSVIDASARQLSFLATRDRDRCRNFYVDVLGLSFISEDGFALVLGCGECQLRVVSVEEFTAQPFTVLGWEVSDIGARAARLAQHGVEMMRFPGMELDAAGVWQAPGGARVCWFKDPDDNLLSLTQHPK